MRLLLDMNLSPQLGSQLAAAGQECVHWSEVGDPLASDETLLRYAREKHFVLLTQDLDFGAMLATTQGEGPSVIQVRMQDVLSERFVTHDSDRARALCRRSSGWCLVGDR